MTGAAILTISTSKAAGDGEDESGASLAELAARLGLEILARDLVGDDRAEIERQLCRWSEAEGCSLIMTTGGTGLSPSDVTPEATRRVIEREVPGIAEAMRAASRPHTPYWMLSRGVAGVRRATLIVNFPGNPRSILELGHELETALPHALALIAGGSPDHRPAR